MTAASPISGNMGCPCAIDSEAMSERRKGTLVGAYGDSFTDVLLRAYGAELMDVAEAVGPLACTT